MVVNTMIFNYYYDDSELSVNKPILSICLLSFEGVFCPNSLRINKFTFPWLNISVQVWNQLIFIVAHAGPEMSYTSISLFRPPGNGKIKFIGKTAIIKIAFKYLCHVHNIYGRCFLPFSKLSSVIQPHCQYQDFH